MFSAWRRGEEKDRLSRQSLIFQGQDSPRWWVGSQQLEMGVVPFP